MHPILFEIGKFKIYSYGSMVALGFLISIWLAGREAKKAGISPQQILDIGLYSLLFGIAGARLLHVLLNPGYYFYRPLEIIMLNRGGLAFHGGLLGGIIAAWYYIRRNRMPLWKTADMMIPYVALGQAIGRIGCVLNGCCYGLPTYSYFGFYPPGSIIAPLHPTQLYSSVLLLAAFVILKLLYEKKRFDGSIFFSYLVLYSFGRFFIDFYRGDLAAVLFGLKMSQLISIAIFFPSVFFLLRIISAGRSKE